MDSINTEHLPPIRLKYVDCREPSDIRDKLLEYGWNQTQLKDGDYSFQTYDYKLVGITRKTVLDLINSVGDKFSYQLENMLDYYAFNVIIIEGSWKNLTPQRVTNYKGDNVNLTWDMCWNFLHRFLAKGFILELTTSEEHTIHRLNVLFALYQKQYSLSAKSKDYVDDRVLCMPSGCRGKSGMKVINTLGSIQAVANASIETLNKVEGIGEKRATSIFNHIRKQSKNSIDMPM